MNSRVIYQRWIRPGWVVFTVVLVVISAWGIAAACGVRLPLVIFALVPLAVVGVMLLIIAALPKRLFERQLSADDSATSQTVELPIQP